VLDGHTVGRGRRASSFAVEGSGAAVAHFLTVVLVDPAQSKPGEGAGSLMRAKFAPDLADVSDAKCNGFLVGGQGNGDIWGKEQHYSLTPAEYQARYGLGAVRPEDNIRPVAELRPGLVPFAVVTRWAVKLSQPPAAGLAVTVDGGMRGLRSVREMRGHLLPRGLLTPPPLANQQTTAASPPFVCQPQLHRSKLLKCSHPRLADGIGRLLKAPHVLFTYHVQRNSAKPCLLR